MHTRIKEPRLVLAAAPNAAGATIRCGIAAAACLDIHGQPIIRAVFHDLSDLIRAEVEQDTPLGRVFKANKGKQDQGQLQPDEEICALIKQTNDRLAKDKVSVGILRGPARNPYQAEWLGKTYAPGEIVFLHRPRNFVIAATARRAENARLAGKKVRPEDTAEIAAQRYDRIYIPHTLPAINVLTNTFGWARRLNTHSPTDIRHNVTEIIHAIAHNTPGVIQQILENLDKPGHPAATALAEIERSDRENPIIPQETPHSTKEFPATRGLTMQPQFA